MVRLPNRKVKKPDEIREVKSGGRADLRRRRSTDVVAQRADRSRQ